MQEKQKVFVGLSGGVDSAVSTALLKKAGYDVTGVFIKTWQPDFIECTWREDRRDAMRVAAYLDIPFITLDLEKEYKEGVADYMINEYKAGRTPNPDVMCNKEVKFGGFLKWAIANGADFVATGHYARNELGIKNYELRIGKDPAKDQAYFLWTLKENQLKKILFPVGNLKKSEVRTLAKKFGLPNAEKKDSQGVCFLGPLDMKNFLKHYIRSKKGMVLNENGEIIGEHSGAVYLTLGERHGFTVRKKTPNSGPFYVVGKNLEKNTITVSENAPEKSLSAKKEYLIENTNWINGFPKITMKNSSTYNAQIRYHGEFLPCSVIKIVANTARIKFKDSVLISPGQSVVLYDGKTCIGGGVAR